MRTSHLRAECLRPRVQVIYSQRKLSCLDERVLSRTVEGLFYSCGSVLQGLEWKFNQVKIHQCLLCSIECSFVRRDNIHYVDTAKARETSQS